MPRLAARLKPPSAHGSLGRLWFQDVEPHRRMDSMSRLTCPRLFWLFVCAGPMNGLRATSLLRASIVAWIALAITTPGLAATAETENFVVSAKSAEAAVAVAEAAEEIRASLAREWLGRDLEDWSEKCVVSVDFERARLGGDTTYSLIRGDVARWRIEVHGPLDRILETLVPHEVLHTVLATHFRDAVPRWADEGAAMSVEAPHEQDRLWKLLGGRLLQQPRRSLAELFAIDVYPENSAELREFYVQGAAVTQFLLTAGKTRFVEFIGAGKQDGWERAVQDCYGFKDIAALEAAWANWLREERAVIVLRDDQLLSQAVANVAEITLAGSAEQAANR